MPLTPFQEKFAIINLSDAIENFLSDEMFRDKQHIDLSQESGVKHGILYAKQCLSTVLSPFCESPDNIYFMEYLRHNYNIAAMAHIKSSGKQIFNPKVQPDSFVQAIENFTSTSVAEEKHKIAKDFFDKNPDFQSLILLIPKIGHTHAYNNLRAAITTDGAELSKLIPSIAGPTEAGMAPATLEERRKFAYNYIDYAVQIMREELEKEQSPSEMRENILERSRNIPEEKRKSFAEKECSAALTPQKTKHSITTIAIEETAQLPIRTGSPRPLKKAPLDNNTSTNITQPSTTLNTLLKKPTSFFKSLLPDAKENTKFIS